jgi:hypothetical protein
VEEDALVGGHVLRLVSDPSLPSSFLCSFGLTLVNCSFTADALGHPQYISATSYNTKLPACSESTSPSGSTNQRRPQRQAQDDAPGIREEDRDDLESSSRSMDTTMSHLNDDPSLQQAAETMVDPKYHYLGTRYRCVAFPHTVIFAL